MSFYCNTLEPKCTMIFLTGLSASGKSTLAHALGERLENSQVIEGDLLREIYGNDLPHGKEGQAVNMDRLIDFTVQSADHYRFVISAFVAPDQKLREKVKNAVQKQGLRFFEVFVDADLQTCKNRDPKGLYKRYELGEDIRLAGLSTPYDIPAEPNFIARTTDFSVQEVVQQIFERLSAKSIQSPPLAKKKSLA